MRPAAALLLALVLGGCLGPAAAPRYEVGAPYRMGGVWSYPAESFAFTETGIAAALPDRRRRLTANGEVWNASEPMASHRTLQLPAVVRVQNLANGRSMLVRVNDRGPERAGRVLGLSARAATLLGVPEGGAPVRVTLEPALSQAVADRAAGRQVGAVAVEAAPRAAVSAESLPPLAGAGRQAATPTAARPVAAAAPASAWSAPGAAIQISPEVTQGTPQPTRLVITAGTFSRADAAAIQQARLASLGAQVLVRRAGREAEHQVRLGPYSDLAAADRALERVYASGVSEAAIRVE